MAVSSDDFEDGSIDGVWTFDDPTGNNSVSESGGELTITVASGAQYELGPGNQDAPRLIQSLPSSSVDFDVHVHITSTPTEDNQWAGICLLGTEDDTGDFHIVNVAYNNRFGGLDNWWVERVDDTSRDWGLDIQNLDPPPEWIRVTRTTDGGTGEETWTFYSKDASDEWVQRFTQTETQDVTWESLGIWAGSTDDQLGYTATFDVFIDADDPLGEGGEENPPEYSAQCDWIRVNSQGVTTIFKPPF